MKIDFFVVAIIAAFICVLIGISALTYTVIDMTYVYPTASENANEHCRSLGFDQYKGFNRVGLWSTIPIGIRCEYAEKYTDLGVRNN